jgi:hypothetical protein
MIQSFDKPGMGGGASAPLPSGGIQGGSRPLQQNVQRMVPNPGQFNGNPRGVYNTNFQGQGNAPSYIQQTNLGRYTPPTMQDGGRYGFNSNTWNNSGGSNYDLRGSYGSPAGQGQFAPMPGMFQQYMQPNMLSGNTFGYGNPYGGMNQDMMYAMQEQQRMGMGPMAPDKVGRPFPSRDMFRGRGADQGGPAPMPAYDRPENRAYNMQALREMMGGF